MRLCRIALTLALATTMAPAAQGRESLAIAELAFRDTSGELRDQTAEHASRIHVFGAALRTSLARDHGVPVVDLGCTGACSPADPGTEALAEMARTAGADLLLVGEIHKISTLISNIRLIMLDLDSGAVRCERLLSYRGDTDEAWQRAARFADRDLTTYCLPDQVREAPSRHSPPQSAH
ncbi:DUF2380 domain-containing protein [Plastorhodobacter daqingensis]|uniref:DUF2380 domain-containing protein n=1 Tax=Plastorhodobacter daqingensis TaxID=1387281 RepID=A0ABW2UHJ9_9RHOB